MLRRFLVTGTVVGLAVFCLLAYTLFDLYRFQKDGGLEARLEKELLPGDGVPTDADRAMLEVIDLAGKTREAEDLWGLGTGKEFPATPARERAEEVLETRAHLRAYLLQQLPPSLEPPGTGVVLQVSHRFRENRDLASLMAGDFLSLLVVGRAEDAVRIWAAVHRMARLLGRGIQQRPSLICKMIEVAEEGTMDRAAAEALRRHLVPPEALDGFERAVRDALAREAGMETTMDAEFELVEKAVRLVDERLGLLQYPLRLYWGNGQEQVATLREAWRTRGPFPEALVARAHLMVQVAAPNFPAARKRWEERLIRRHGVLAALALERARQRSGEYVEGPVAGVTDPSSGGSFHLVRRGDRWTLHADGPDGRDDGGHRDRDVRIWE